MKTGTKWVGTVTLFFLIFFINSTSTTVRSLQLVNFGFKITNANNDMLINGRVLCLLRRCRYRQKCAGLISFSVNRNWSKSQRKRQRRKNPSLLCLFCLFWNCGIVELLRRLRCERLTSLASHGAVASD